MSRYFLRIAIAILCFSIGFFGVWASGYWKSFEDFIVDRFACEPNISFSRANEFNQFDNAREIEDTKAVYKAILDKQKRKLFVIRKTKSLSFDASLNEEQSKLFVAAIQKKWQEVDNDTLIDYLNKTKITNSLPIPLEQTSKIKILDEPASIIQHNFDPSNPTPMYNFSNVGFNLDRTQAFVYMLIDFCHSFYCSSCLKINYIFLKKQNGQWIIAKENHVSFFS